MMSKYTKRNLARPAMTRFATGYLTLKSLLMCKNRIRKMFTSDEWFRCSFSKTMVGKEVQEIVFGDAKFWKSISIA